MMQKKWYALYVSSRAEKKVGLLLTENNIEAYVPLVKTMRHWSDRKKKVEVPLINGYVFTRIEATERDRVLQTRGVVGFVKHEGKDAVVRENEINYLKIVSQSGNEAEVGLSKELPELGAEVKPRWVARKFMQ